MKEALTLKAHWQLPWHRRPGACKLRGGGCGHRGLLRTLRPRRARPGPADDDSKVDSDGDSEAALLERLRVLAAFRAVARRDGAVLARLSEMSLRSLAE